jgi:preprotein translocase subunit SecG
MLIIFGVLITLSSIALGIIVLVQNPKGGGLSGSFGGVGNQLMGVKQTTDVLEKGTWAFAALVGVLCILSPIFMPKNVSSKSKNDSIIEAAPSAPSSKQGPTAPMPDTNKH